MKNNSKVNLDRCYQSKHDIFRQLVAFERFDGYSFWKYLKLKRGYSGRDGTLDCKVYSFYKHILKNTLGTFIKYWLVGLK